MKPNQRNEDRTSSALVYQNNSIVKKRRSQNATWSIVHLYETNLIHHLNYEGTKEIFTCKKKAIMLANV